ncbi:hypothetical protein KQX54_002465 [Cotesia glomerata]|uniref:Uncharacterized protein n=1 Tax=Cotesia glomerata TaxID=32391 RepID=A0AAV7I8G7_COTGL|nr:hypothetical protein KQX54_002465 [Cotesia glomerata]
MLDAGYHYTLHCTPYVRYILVTIIPGRLLSKCSLNYSPELSLHCIKQQRGSTQTDSRVQVRFKKGIDVKKERRRSLDVLESCFKEQRLRLRQLTCVPAPVKPDADGKNGNRLHSTTRPDWRMYPHTWGVCRMGELAAGGASNIVLAMMRQRRQRREAIALIVHRRIATPSAL